MDDPSAWAEFLSALSWWIRYGNNGEKLLVFVFSFLIIGGTGSGITALLTTWLRQRHERLMQAQETARLEAISKLAESAQLKLLETFPTMNPNDPDDIEAARKAKKELALLEVKREVSE